ncbi:MAG TPA: immunoglobulin domain-containing protein [Dongiaceae bacterium]|nr:immunoglobulin domain-containing protein [Dongiaceae bacterium]
MAALLGAGAICGSASGAPISVPNFSFELWTNASTGFGLDDGAGSPGPDVSPNWLGAGNGGINIYNPLDADFSGTTGSPGTLPATGDGTNYLRIGLGNTGQAWQTIGTWQSNTVYTLTVAAGNALAGDGGLGRIALLKGSFPAGTVIAAAAVDTTAVTPGTFADTTLVFTNGQTSGAPLTIMLQGTGGSGGQMIYDNVRLDGTAAAQTPAAFVPTAAPSINPYLGTLVTLTEDPAGAAPFTYQWQTDGGNGGTSFSDISGATNATYVADTGATGVGTFEYRVVVGNSFGSSTSGALTLTVQEGSPVITSDTHPGTAVDVLGSSVTFTAAFDGTRPISYQWQLDGSDVPGATNATLTLTNLQFTDMGSYSLVASNAGGIFSSTPAPLTVNPVPDPTNNIIMDTASQLGSSTFATFSPTWAISTNGDLIAGTAPSTVGPGAFNDPQEHIAGTPAVLTDGRFGTLFGQGITSPDVVTGGTAGSGAGQYVIYTLPASANGWDITNIVTYGGWADAGRDAQRYVLYYSTIAAPTNFLLLADVAYNPDNPSSIQSATRVTLASGDGGAYVKSVAALKFDFSTLNNGPENGFVGYTEIQVYGTNSAANVVLTQDTTPGTASDVEGGSVTFTAAFSGATTYQWLKVVGGVTNPVAGATSPTLTLSNLQFGDAGTYLLKATGVSGSAMSSGSTLTVNSVGNALISGDNLVASAATQTGRGQVYTPNWLPATNADLIRGTAPTGVGSGVFNQEGCGGIAVLTDGAFGSVGSAINSSLCSVGQNAGQSVTYTLAGSSSGYDITNIVTFGGWSDAGRDEQGYTVSYSTVFDPATFIPIGTVDFNPGPVAGPSAVRLSLSPASGLLATNVSRIRFDFTVPGIENGWGGAAEIAVQGQASAAVPIAPYITQDILPVTGSDVVGSQVIMTAAFDGSSPITYQWQNVTGGVTNDIVGATSPSLTLNNLQLTDAGSYQLRASNAVGVAYSTANTFTVNPVPDPVSGVIVSPANQTASGAFVPTWAVASGSLIASQAPSSTGLGNFTAEGATGTSVLTDGALNLWGGGVAGLATLGSGAGGHSITYTLTGSAGGYDITSIVSYAGWADGGRDQQAYTVSYSTVADPATFITIGSANYNPDLPGAVPSADRVTISSASATPLASGAGMITFNFLTPAGENGYSGYAEFQVFGTPVSGGGPGTVDSVQLSAGSLVLTGSGWTPNGTYTWLTSTNAGAPISEWTTNATGTFSGTGTFSNAIPVSGTTPASFFRLKTP